MLQYIAQPVQQELQAFETLYKEALHTQGTDFQSMIDFISDQKGKRIRPLVVLLSAKLGGATTSKTLDYAVILELLHTATLIHDDVVDSTRERRGKPSVMAQYDNRAAVLLGDYILSRAISLGVASENLRILKILSDLSYNLAVGELKQLITSSEIIIDEQRYFDVIWKKTATLLASCSEMGAISADVSEEKIQILRLIGENLGICFQLRDDIFDYYEEGDLGKPTGNDIREGKITLPLIYALKNAPQKQADEMLEIIQKQDFSSSTIQQLIAFAKEYHGIEYATSKMQEFKTKTLELLSEFPDSETKMAFVKLIDYIIERKK
jgi:octaprenyl-diphosphate synthase